MDSANSPGDILWLPTKAEEKNSQGIQGRFIHCYKNRV